MPDGYAHKYNGQCAMNIAGYKPRNYRAFILVCNGPDPLYFYQMYNPWRKISLTDLGKRMHTEKTGLFLQNLFRFAGKAPAGLKLRHRLPQGWGSLIGSIVGLIILQRRPKSILDGLGGIKIRLSDG